MNVRTYEQNVLLSVLESLRIARCDAVLRRVCCVSCCRQRDRRVSVRHLRRCAV